MRTGDSGDERDRSDAGDEAARASRRAAKERWRRSPAGKAWIARYNAEHREKRLQQNRDYNLRPDVIERKVRNRVENAENLAARRREIEQRHRARLAARDLANAKKRANYHDDPEPAKARAKAWVEANPDRVKQIKAASRERNREARRARDRERYAAEAEQRRQAQREYRARPENREKIAAQKRESERRRRSADRDAYAAYQREYRAREKRRRELGLPPRPLRRSTRAEVEANEVAAFDFFVSRRRDAVVRALKAESLAVHRAATDAPAELTSEAALRDAQRLIELIDRRAQRESERFAAFMASRAGDELREEVQMDNAARIHFGKKPYPDVLAEVNRRASALLEEETQRLRSERARILEAQARRAATGPETGGPGWNPGAGYRRSRTGPARS
ncbi:hypothetical protein [Gryllotalpicola protaetiae]|uniref:hypothetical protein n=1 Tax=Gryllotalpicola protaetiae TaxID=2419771 RepID=UPI0013C4DC0B|nr:hypothetical protein [Gryllotalpicola protaetiae]